MMGCLLARPKSPCNANDAFGFCSAPQAEDVEQFETDLQQLMAMGFPKRKAMEALVECSGNVHLSVEYLFANCV